MAPPLGPPVQINLKKTVDASIHNAACIVDDVAFCSVRISSGNDWRWQPGCCCATMPYEGSWWEGVVGELWGLLVAGRAVAVVAELLLLVLTQ